MSLWLNIKNTLCERGQIQKVHMVCFIYMNFYSERNQALVAEIGMVIDCQSVCQKLAVKEHGEGFWGDGNILELDLAI